MSLFDKLLGIAHTIVEETKNRDTPLLQSHFNDINQFDKDIVLNDMQAGDHWMWIIKSNGCGTYMFLLDGNVDIGFVSRLKDENSIVFMIRVTAENEGEVIRVKSGDALGYADRKMVLEGRIPRRLSMYSQLSDLMRLSKISVALSDTKLWCDFSVSKGDVSTLTIIPNGSALSITIKRDRMNLPEGVSSREPLLNTVVKLGSHYDPCEEYEAVYEIEATDSLHAVFKKVA